MTNHPVQSFTRSASARGFTVVELLVAISVLTLIVLVLYGLFDQVQKALRGNIAQVDVLEGGRATMQLLSTEMEQMDPGSVPDSTNLFISITAPPYQQAMLDPGTNRLNLLDQVFFVSHLNKTWIGTGYRVLFLNNNGIPAALAENGVGTLCRYSFTNVTDSDFPNVPPPPNNPNSPRTNLFWQVMNRVLMNGIANPPPGNLTNYQPVLDGVVHFHVRAFDKNGLLITDSVNTNIASGFQIWSNRFNNDVEYAYTFTNQALPSYLEVNLGILEPHVLERFKGFPNSTVASNYLARQAGAVHLFQQRIPVRTAK